MADSLQLIVTKDDGTVVTISGNITGAKIVETAPAVVPPPVIVPPPPVEPSIPVPDMAVDMLPATWAMNHDTGTPGSAIGTSTYPVNAPDGTVNCREFQFTLTAKGGFIYHANVMKDSSAFNTFCIETEEYFVDPSNLACHEKDLEQVDATGTYVDMATQLNGNAGFLDYTANQSWQHTTVKANPTAIPKGTWYPTKRYFRNNGNGTYTLVGSNDGGTYSPLNFTVKSQPSAKWGKNILNFQYQFDGKSSGSVQSTVYVRVMKIHCGKS